MQFASNRVYATVERSLPDKGYCFARVTEPEALKVFVHFSKARLVETKPDGLWLAEEVEKRQPQPGDHLFMVIEHGDRGYYAKFWGFDPAPRLWNYRDLTYRHWPRRQKSAVIAFRDFLDLCRRAVPGCEGFRKDYLDSPEEQAFVSRLAQAYADECVEQLLAAGRPYVAIAELEMLDTWRHGLKLDIDVSVRLTRAKLAAMSTVVSGGLDELIKRMREERNAGRPSTALHLYKQVTNQEHAEVEKQSKRSRHRGPIVGAEWQLMRSRFAPISTSFEQDPAMVNLHQTCVDAMIREAQGMMGAINHHIDNGEHLAITDDWRQYHDADEHFEADSMVGDLIYALVSMGMWTELRILAPLLESREAYQETVRRLRNALPVDRAAADDPNRFQVVEGYLVRALSDGYSDRALTLYTKYVVDRGDSFLFCSKPSREDLIRKVHAQAPLDAIGTQINVVSYADSTRDGEATTLVHMIIDASSESQAHPSWTEVLAMAYGVLEHDTNRWASIERAFPIVAARAAGLAMSRRQAEANRNDGHGRWH